MAPRRRWVLTGASGWFGRTALWDPEQLHGHNALRNDVIVCASTPKEIDFGSPYGSVMAVSLETLDTIDCADGLIHLAFLTRERIVEMGVMRYIALNRAITDRVAEFIRRNPNIPTITTSSGAAAVYDETTPDLTANPYAALKQEEEALWRHSGAQRMAAVFRVYAASGRFIKDSKVFALRDFLGKALVGKRIEIHSERPVIRSYGAVMCMLGQ